MHESKKRTLFIYYGLHPSHKAMAKALKADFFPAPKVHSDSKNPIAILKWLFQTLSFLIKVPKNYDIYFCEGTYIFPAIARKLGLLSKNAKIINILASPLLYYMKIGRVKGIKRWIGIKMLKEVDSFVCIGKMEEELLKETLPNAKSIVAYPFIQENTRKLLLKKKNILPDLDSHNILFIASGTNISYYKGIDLLIKAFKIVKRKWPDARLNIIGKISDINTYLEGNRKGIKVWGRTTEKNKVELLKSSAIYVHLGRGDTFPVAVLEAMLSGLPVLVSEWTGTKEIIKDKKLIVKLDIDKIVELIDKYFSLNIKEKKTISMTYQKKALEFTERNTIDDFKTKIVLGV